MFLNRNSDLGASVPGPERTRTEVVSTSVFCVQDQRYGGGPRTNHLELASDLEHA